MLLKYLILTSIVGISITVAKVDVEVLVIGAGAAGIAAATKLAKNGIDVQILEVEDRIGGRIKSVPFGDAVIDLGAEWCHGEEDNIVYEMMKDTGSLHHANYTFEPLYHSSGIQFDADLDEELSNIFGVLYNVDGYRVPKEGQSLGEHFATCYYEIIKAQYRKNQTRYIYAQEALDTFHGHVISSEGALSWDDPSAVYDFTESKGDNLITWGGKGYKTFLNHLLNGFEQDKRILLNTEVLKISHNNTDEVVVSILREGDILSDVKASHVIFTPSLGVLKAKHSELFSPNLRSAKVHAIETLGIGGVMKVIVHYEKRWWSEGDSFSGFAFVWSNEDKDTLIWQFKKGPQREGRSWLSNFRACNRLEHNPRSLSCWFTGTFVPDIEKMPDDILIEGITFALKKIFGSSKGITTPDKFLRTKWYTDPHFQGTYSFQTVESRKLKPSANEILSQPINDNQGIPRILFAGETTNPLRYSTVHGAAESGFREADRIIKLKKKTD